MASPSAGTGLPNLVPSASVLQQLLEDIKSSNTPTVLQGQDSSLTSSRASSTSITSASSVWVGGGLIAQDAREKLRAADLARYEKISRSNNEAATCDNLQRPLQNKRSHARMFSSDGTTGRHTPCAGKVSKWEECNMTAAPHCSKFRIETRPSRARPTLGGLHLPQTPAFEGAPCWISGSVAAPKSPCIFSDVDSDISMTPSPTEPPTSAVSSAWTDSTADTNAAITHPDENGPRSLAKRSRSRATSPEMLFKRSRTVNAPALTNGAENPHEHRSILQDDCFVGDDRYLIRDPYFLGRIPVTPEVFDPKTASTVLAISSFRPEAAGAQGVPSISVTSTRHSTPRPSPDPQDGSPASTETPIFDRTLHLVDSDLSIYKKDHGDESNDHPLCLYCFRTHGAFNRILDHGYEACERDVVLESHY